MSNPQAEQLFVLLKFLEDSPVRWRIASYNNAEMVVKFNIPYPYNPNEKEGVSNDNS